MKELENFDKPELVITKQKEQKKESNYVGTIKFHKGHTLYKMNVSTKEISKAKFEVVDYKVDFDKKLQNRKRKVIIEKGYIYASALNEKNAIKKFNK